MARGKYIDDQNDDGVQDSFLDIVANIVGILILLVIVVGIRASLQPTRKEVSGVESVGPLVTQASLEEQARLLHRTGAEMVQLRRTLQRVEEETQIKEHERMQLSQYIAAIEHRLANEKQALSERDAERLEIRTQLASADLEFEALMREKVGLETAFAEPTKLVHTPTPVVRSDSEKMLHLRIEHGKVAIVPFDGLYELRRNKGAQAVNRDLERQGGIGRVGPIDDFVMYFVQWTRPFRDPSSGATGTLTEVAGEIHPQKGGLGVTVEEALAPNSSLSTALASTSPQETIVVMWTYPDSVSEFRELQTALRDRGFAVDMRIVEEGRHIGFAPVGRKAAAQ